MISFSPFYDVPETTLEALDSAAARRVREIAELAAGLKYPRHYPVRWQRKSKPKRNTRPRPIRCIETGQVYPSIGAAARETGTWKTAIYDSMKPRRWVRNPQALHWEFV